METSHLCYPIQRNLLVNKECPEKWKLLGRVGETSLFAEVWQVCCKEDCQWVMKYLPYDNGNTEEMIRKEVEIQNSCAVLGLCPKVADAWLCEEGGAIVMEVFDKTIESLLLEYKSQTVRALILSNVITLLDKLHYHGFYHGDAHLNNFMVRLSLQEYEKLSEEEHALLSEEKEYKNNKYNYFFIDLGQGGRLEDMSDSHIRDDYSNVYDHLLELADQDPSFQSLVEIMEIHMKKFD